MVCEEFNSVVENLSDLVSRGEEELMELADAVETEVEHTTHGRRRAAVTAPSRPSLLAVIWLRPRAYGHSDLFIM